MIDWTRYPQIEYMARGQNVRVYHCKPEGSRGNDACIITRLDKGYIAYCHHCGEKGFKGTKKRPLIKISSDPVRSSTGLHFPKDSNPDISTWDSNARVWVRKYGIKDLEVSSNNIAYSAYRNALLFPVYNTDRVMTGIVQRSFNPKDAKYLTFKLDENSSIFWYSFEIPSDKVVLCEDIISGIKLARHINVISCLGTNLSNVILKEVIKRFKNFYVWLDNDNRIVKKRLQLISRKLELFGNVKIIHLSDPKHYSDSEIVGQL